MRIDSISPASFKAAVKIRGAENQGRVYLYNEVNSLMREFRIPAVFKTEEIDLPSVSNQIISKLNKLGIKFISVSK